MATGFSQKLKVKIKRNETILHPSQIFIAIPIQQNRRMAYFMRHLLKTLCWEKSWLDKPVNTWLLNIQLPFLLFWLRSKFVWMEICYVDLWKLIVIVVKLSFISGVVKEASSVRIIIFMNFLYTSAFENVVFLQLFRIGFWFLEYVFFYLKNFAKNVCCSWNSARSNILAAFLTGFVLDLHLCTEVQWVILFSRKYKKD